MRLRTPSLFAQRIFVQRNPASPEPFLHATTGGPLYAWEDLRALWGSKEQGPRWALLRHGGHLVAVWTRTPKRAEHVAVRTMEGRRVPVTRMTDEDNGWEVVAVDKDGEPNAILYDSKSKLPVRWYWLSDGENVGALWRSGKSRPMSEGPMNGDYFWLTRDTP